MMTVMRMLRMSNDRKESTTVRKGTWSWNFFHPYVPKIVKVLFHLCLIPTWFSFPRCVWEKWMRIILREKATLSTFVCMPLSKQNLIQKGHVYIRVTKDKSHRYQTPWPGFGERLIMAIRVGYSIKHCVLYSTLFAAVSIVLRDFS